MLKPPTLIVYRLGIASRTLAAAVGGYAVAALLAMALARALPMARSEAAAAATVLAVLAMPAAAIRVFAAPSAGRAWGELLIAALLLGGLAYVLGPPA